MFVPSSNVDRGKWGSMGRLEGWVSKCFRVNKKKIQTKLGGPG